MRTRMVDGLPYGARVLGCARREDLWSAAVGEAERGLGVHVPIDPRP
ncbi:hypothetical protein [Streptomyces sp. NPDC059008]